MMEEKMKQCVKAGEMRCHTRQIRPNWAEFSQVMGYYPTFGPQANQPHSTRMATANRSVHRTREDFDV
jgi:hypothetical protein